RVPGSAARRKTPTGYCGNTCRSTPTCLRFRNQNSTQLHCVSILGHDKRWDFKLRLINSRPVLHRPLEATRVTGNWLLNLPWLTSTPSASTKILRVSHHPSPLDSMVGFLKNVCGTLLSREHQYLGGPAPSP